MSRFTQSNLSRRRDARRERAEVKRHPDAFEFSEEQLAAFDSAYSAAKDSGLLQQYQQRSALELDLRHGGAL